ncbi:ribonuclease P protein component [Mobilicoccus pelagius]|uniref:Ribonuclease P protein component n=1 Tax=Mobilicoccus pelagius NBRC 104925 TaxID=1089455 RepID=H5USY0_9MICO|nr:ribonuclease P protein component [Mobilicoccus pelagius]GAB48838.1 ribonuclease P protein component [Mobilicoccus pelagius NBRC 104925]
MLPAPHRLRRREEFARAVRGRRSGSRLVVVHVRASQPTVPQCRVGFVVSKAVGNAVTRNRVKRRLRAITADLLPRLPEGHDLVVRANPAAADASYAALEGDLTRLVDKAVGAAVSGAAGRDD